MIKEIIVVEGKDDTVAIKRAVEAETIETGGSAIGRSCAAADRAGSAAPGRHHLYGSRPCGRTDPQNCRTARARLQACFSSAGGGAL